MVGPLKLFPSGPGAATAALQRGVLFQVAGILVLSAALFVRMPLLLVIVIPVGVLLIVLGFVAWLWATFRVR